MITSGMGWIDGEQCKTVMANPMSAILAVVRIILTIIVLVLLTVLILLTGWIPVPKQGVSVAAWLTTRGARLLLQIFNIKLVVNKRELFEKHQGMIFPNHTSYLDILALISILPVRFVSKAEVRNWPLIGYIARAIGTVFVKREDKSSRAKTRSVLVDEKWFPAIVLFPEGTTTPPDILAPFRFGAFEIAVEGEIPYLPCIIHYSQPQIAYWGRMPLPKAVWRLGTRPGVIVADVSPVPATSPAAADDPQHLAHRAHLAMSALLVNRNEAAAQQDQA